MTIHTKGAYDFRQYDRVWQRVAPALNPWSAEETENGAAALPSGGEAPACPPAGRAEDWEALTGLLEEELAEQRQLAALAKQAPGWARLRLRDLAACAGGRAKRLGAIHYLLSGEAYCPAVCVDRIYVGRWCPALRERYHAAACAALRYRRAAEEGGYPCFTAAFAELERSAAGQAAEILRLLERSVTT